MKDLKPYKILIDKAGNAEVFINNDKGYLQPGDLTHTFDNEDRMVVSCYAQDAIEAKDIAEEQRYKALLKNKWGTES